MKLANIPIIINSAPLNQHKFKNNNFKRSGECGNLQVSIIPADNDEKLQAKIRNEEKINRVKE